MNAMKVVVGVVWTLVAATHAYAAPVARAAEAQDPVRVVATLPIYAEIAREIGGPFVQATSIADPAEDAHFVRPKPSFALEIRRADLFVTTGLDLELWVPALLDRAGNAGVSEGGAGYVTAYTGIELRDVPPAADRSEGDIHVYGNPHIYTDPLNVEIIARNIATGLKRVAPDRAEAFDEGLERFVDRIHRRVFGDDLVDLLRGETLARLARQGRLFDFLRNNEYRDHPLIGRLGGWLARGQSFRGRTMICYHKNWAYFEHRFGVECAEYVEGKAGIPPTPGHVRNLVRRMQSEGIGVLFAANYFDRSKVERVAERSGARTVIVPMEPGGAPGVDSYFDLVDTWVDALARAFGDDL